MDKKLIICRNCMESTKDLPSTSQFQYRGVFAIFKVPDDNICPKCKSILETTNISIDEYKIISKISNDNAFLEAMIDLKQKDIIEYELKMGQFRNQVEQQKSIQNQQVQVKQESNVPKCPKCGCTEFTPVRKKFSLLTGFATNKVELICNKCGTKIKK